MEMVIVDEDCAIENPGITGRRGLAGTVFVHKVHLKLMSVCRQHNCSSNTSKLVYVNLCALKSDPDVFNSRSDILVAFVFYFEMRVPWCLSIIKRLATCFAVAASPVMQGSRVSPKF